MEILIAGGLENDERRKGLRIQHNTLASSSVDLTFDLLKSSFCHVQSTIGNCIALLGFQSVAFIPNGTKWNEYCIRFS